MTMIDFANLDNASGWESMRPTPNEAIYFPHTWSPCTLCCEVTVG